MAPTGFLNYHTILIPENSVSNFPEDVYDAKWYIIKIFTVPRFEINSPF